MSNNMRVITIMKRGSYIYRIHWHGNNTRIWEYQLVVHNLNK